MNYLIWNIFLRDGKERENRFPKIFYRFERKKMTQIYQEMWEPKQSWNTKS